MRETKSVTTAIYLDMNEGLGEDEHRYHFVGKVGSFCPIKPGMGGGVLLREKEGKYYAVNGTKGYRWLEAEVVETLGKQEDIDRSYYKSLVDDAVENISKFGDFEWFVSDDIVEYGWPECNLNGRSTICSECEHWVNEPSKPTECKLGFDCMPF